MNEIPNTVVGGGATVTVAPAVADVIKAARLVGNWCPSTALEPMRPDLEVLRQSLARLARETVAVDDSFRFRLGDEVVKTGGDYFFPGTVVGLIRKLSRAPRYVVEDDRGTLFIFRGEQLSPRGDNCSLAEGG